jgi:hypothetical protein
MKRRVEAAMIPLTDMVGRQTKKARSLLLGQSQGRAMVSLSNKATGEGVGALPPVFTSTHPGKRTTSKLPIPLSPPLPGPSRHGAGNERPTI